MDHSTEPLLRRVAKVLLWIVIVAAGLYSFMVWADGVTSTQWYRDNEVEGWIAVASLPLLLVAVVGLLVLTDKIEGGAGLAALVVIGIGVATIGWTHYKHDDYNSNRLLVYYCGYGAESRKQLVQCIEHVNPGYVYYSDTPAAQFAENDNRECGSGAGPLCKTVFDMKQAQAAYDAYQSGSY